MTRANRTVPDSDMATTHIRCGSDIRAALRTAGFRGEFVEFSDPVCQGPVPAAGDLLATRAAFISGTCDVSLARARRSLQRADAALQASRSRERVVLWFEHDSYDQLILARVLAAYHAGRAPRVLELVQADHFPGVSRFIGLGQLSPANLRALWDDRQPVSQDRLALGHRTWDALRSSSPMELHEIATGAPASGVLRGALRRHLQELPWRCDGLSLTQRLTLQLVAEQDRTAGEVFDLLTHEREPLVFLGDAMFWAVVRELLAGPTPALSMDSAASRRFADGALSLTRAGRALLESRLDWMATGPAERWVGGVCLRAGSGWRWDDSAGAPCLS